MSPTTRSEQETIFRWDDDEKIVHIFSASPVTWRKLARLGIRPQRETTRSGAPSGKFYRVALAELSWGRKRRMAPGHGFGSRTPRISGPAVVFEPQNASEE